MARVLPVDDIVPIESVDGRHKLNGHVPLDSHPSALSKLAMGIMYKHGRGETTIHIGSDRDGEDIHLQGKTGPVDNLVIPIQIRSGVDLVEVQVLAITTERWGGEQEVTVKSNTDEAGSVIPVSSFVAEGEDVLNQRNLSAAKWWSTTKEEGNINVASQRAVFVTGLDQDQFFDDLILSWNRKTIIFAVRIIEIRKNTVSIQGIGQL